MHRAWGRYCDTAMIRAVIACCLIVQDILNSCHCNMVASAESHSQCWSAQKKSGPSLKHTGHSDIHSRSIIKQTTKRNVVSKYSILSIKRLCCTFQFNQSLWLFYNGLWAKKSAILRALYCSDNVVRQCLAKTKVYKKKIPCIVKH